MKTYSAKATDVERKWYILDASKIPLGRLSTVAAELLLGKGKPMFTHHVDVGDYVIVINSDSLVVTGDKLEKKVYYSHSFYPGGLKSATLREKMENNSEFVIKHSIRGMLPVNKLRDGRLARLKIYNDDNHNHNAQQPVEYKLGKNK